LNLTEKVANPFSGIFHSILSFVSDFTGNISGLIKKAVVVFFGDNNVFSILDQWLAFFSFWFWSVNFLGFAFGNSAATFFNKLDGVSSSGTVGTLNSDLSFNGLGGRAATTLSFHFTVFVNSRTDTFTVTHVDFEVSFSFTEHTVDFNRNSADEIGGNGASANRLFNWCSAFFNATIFRPVDVFFWAFFEHDFPGGKAFSVDVSFSLFTGALDTSIFGSGPGITDLSFFVVLVSAAQWNAHTAAHTGVRNSDMSHWAITATLSVADGYKQTFHVWSAWARASGAHIAHWAPSGTWLVSFTFELTDIESDTSPLNMSWTLSTNDWGVNWSSAVWARLKWWLNVANTFDGVLAAITNVDVRESSSDHTVGTWQAIGTWAVGGVANTFEVVAASWSGWVVGLDQNWAATSVGASSGGWSWAANSVTNTFFLVDGGATGTWRFGVDFGGGDHLESSWAGGFLVVDWAEAGVARASVLWATFGVGGGHDRATALASWSFWAEFWFGNADLIVSGTASVVIVVDVNGDWQLFDEATEFNGAVFDNWSSAMFWVTDTFELWTTVGFSGTFFTVSTSGRNCDGDLFTGDTVGLSVSFQSFGASGGITNTRFATATRVSRFEKSFVDVADWVSVVEWARFFVTLASPDWATVVGVIRVVSEGFDFTESTSSTDWAFWAVFGDVFSALDWLTPFFSATSSSIRTDSFDFEFVARNSFVVTFNELFDDHTWRVASASSFDTFIFLSAVVLVPEFTGSMFNSAFISANVAISWVDTFVALKNESFSTEATLLDVFDHAPSFVKTVQLVVITSFWSGWSASGPFFVGVFASLSWTGQVVVLSVSEVWNDVFVSPVVDTVSGVARALLSEVVDLFTTSVETFEDIE